jgi:hypothetical protein
MEARVPRPRAAPGFGMMAHRDDIRRMPATGSPRRARRRRRAGSGVPGLACLIVFACPLGATPLGDAAPEAVRVSAVLTPDTLHVAPGEVFSLELRIDVAGRRFNAYDATVAFDTTALAYEPPSAAREGEGPLMTGACGNTFHRMAARGDSLTISHAILCAGVALTGPGTLHHVRFRALDHDGATAVRLRRVQFYDAGLFVNPARARDAVVIVSEKKPAEGATGLRAPRARPTATPYVDVADQPSAGGRWQG